MHITTIKELVRTGRPKTAGAYGFVLTLVSFTFFPQTSWDMRIITAACYFGLTMSIMSFNDYIDRHHDRKKGKNFASEHPHTLLGYWAFVSVTTGCAMLAVAAYDPHVALLCLEVWLLGHFYSFVPHWYIVQNCIVALCAASPALCGAVYYRTPDAECIYTFALFAVLTFQGELYKDLEDEGIDKATKRRCQSCVDMKIQWATWHAPASASCSSSRCILTLG